MRLSIQEVGFKPKAKALIPNSIMVALRGLRDFVCYDADDDDTIVDNPPIEVKPSPEIAPKRQRMNKTILHQAKPLLDPKEYRKVQATIKSNDIPIEYAFATGISFNLSRGQTQMQVDYLKQTHSLILRQNRNKKRLTV